MTAPRTTHANHQEDLEVLKFFCNQPGVFVEAGANHPVEGSQTYLLEQHGWRGVLIEPNPKLASLCREQRPDSRVFECAVVQPGGPDQVLMAIPADQTDAQASITAAEQNITNAQATFVCPARTLDSILNEAGINRIDFFSIDLEGYEAMALLGFSWERWKPQLLSVEDHCESLRTHRLICRNRYRPIRRVGDNNWYVPQAATHRFPLAERLGFIRKVYLSLPFRKLRSLFKKLSGAGRIACAA